MWIRQIAVMREIVKAEIGSEKLRGNIIKEDIKNTMKMGEEQSGEAQTLLSYIITKQYWKNIGNKQKKCFSRAHTGMSFA